MADTDLIVPAATQNSPYYDDYDQNKEFYRILFRPGKAVQARELTQSQTIGQKQIQRFGQGIYKNGSLVTGGVITYQTASDAIQYINLATQYANTNITANNFVGQTIVSTNNATGNVTARGYVLAADELNSTEPPTLIIKKLNGVPFLANDTIKIINTTTYANIAAGNPTGNSSIASIDEGVFFINGFFALVKPQTIFLDKYDSTPSYRVGLEFTETIIDETQDTSLLDPAQESSNYQAPGASRYKIDMNFSKRSLTSTDDSSFVEVLRVQDGEILKVVDGPGFSVLGDTLARRTYDQSGNFTVKPFLGSLHEHITSPIPGTVSVLATGNAFTGANTNFLRDVSIGSTIYANNQQGLVNAISSNVNLTTSNTFLYGASSEVAYVNNPNKFSFTLSPGKGYVAGYEFQTVGPTVLDVDRGRSFANLSSYNLDSALGNDLFVTNVKGLPDIGAMEQYDLHSTQHQNINFTNSTYYQNTVIGNAKIRAIQYSSGPVGNADAEIYNAYLFDVNITNSSFSLAQVNSLAQFANTSIGAYQKKMNIDVSSKDTGTMAGNTFLNDTGFNTLVFPYPQSTIVPGSITGVNYKYRVIVPNVTFTNGVAAITTTLPASFVGNGTLSDAEKETNFVVSVKDNRGQSFAANGNIIPLGTANGRSVVVSPITTATINTAYANTFLGDIIYTVGLSGTAPTPRVKSLVSANTANVQTSGGTTISSANTIVYATNGQIVIGADNVVRTSANSQSLYVSDVYSLVAVYDYRNNPVNTANLVNAVDVTSSYILDNGQRDNYYDHAKITLKAGSTPPSGPLAVFVNYFTHSGSSGYLDVDSYPNVGTNAGYAAVPTYISPTTGISYNLRDCIDWRPKRVNANASFQLTDSDTGTSSYILEPGQAFVSSFSYYLPRIDKVVLSPDLTFKVIQGIPNLYPEPPVEGSSDMLLYTLQIPAYTFQANSVNVIYNENKRYTMRDIGKLDRRIQNLEYYASLSLLETSATNLTINDGRGLNAFKNGIIVDNFSGHSVGAVDNYDYACSMDFNNLALHPMFISNNAIFKVNTGGSSNYAYDGDQVTLSYDLVEYISQPYATTDISVNPFNFVAYVGQAMLIPDNDTWYDQVTRPQVLVNLDGGNDAWETINSTLSQLSGGPSNGFGTQYGDWQTNWTGVVATDSQQATNQFQATSQNPFGGTTTQTFQETTTTSYATIQTDQQRTYTSSVLGSQTITQDIGNSIVSEAIEPYIRARDVIVHANGLQPSTVMYPFFDGKPMQGYWNSPLVLAINMSTLSGTFHSETHSEVVTSSSGGKGILMSQPWQASIAGSTVYPYMALVNVTGTFNVGDTLTGSVAGATATVTGVYRLSDTVPSFNGNANQITLNSSATSSNTLPVGHTINISKSSVGAEGQVRVITAYNGVTKVATVSPNWDNLPTAGDTYSISSPRTSPSGVLSGTLSIPNSSKLKFLAGQKQFLLTSDPTGSTVTALTYATGQYYAQGLLQTVQDTVISTRVPMITTVTGVQNQSLQQTVVTGTATANTLIGEVYTAPPCFLAGTEVIMGNRTVKMIEELKEGDEVLSFSEDGLFKIAKIKEMLIHESNAGKDEWKLVTVTVDTGTKLHVTRNHPVQVIEGSKWVWKHVGELNVGDKLVGYVGEPLEIINISEPLPDAKVYNFELDEYHTYFANDIRVHNGCGCGHGTTRK